MKMNTKSSAAIAGLLALIATAAYAAGFDRVRDTLKIGQGGATTKTIEFDNGNTATNAKISSTSGNVVSVSPLTTNGPVYTSGGNGALNSEATLSPVRGGTGQSAWTLGDFLYGSGTNTVARLAGNTTTTNKFLTQTGTGAVSAAPAWSVIADADVPTTLTSKTVGIGNGTVSAPSLNFTSDADGSGTGLYRVGANSLGVAANGVQTLGVASSLVTVGQTGTAETGNPILRMYGGTGGAGTGRSAQMAVDSVNRDLVFDATNGFDFYVSGVNEGATAAGNYAFSIGSNGKVTIGSPATSYNGVFDVSGNGSSAQIKLTRTGSGSGYIGADGTNAFNIYDSSVNGIWSISQAGSVTAGPTSGTATHTFKALGSATVKVQSTTTSQNTQLQFSGNYAGPTAQLWGLGMNISRTSGDLEFYNFSSPGSVGFVTRAGAWTLGPTSGLTTSHIIQNSTSTSGASTLQVQNNDATSSSDASPGINVIKGSTTNTSAQIFLRFYSNTGSSNMGAIAGNGAGNAAFITTSDARLKHNVTPIQGALGKIAALTPVSYDYNDGSGHNEGFVAQDLEKVFPNDVSADESTPQKYKRISGWSHQMAYLVGAIKELKADFDHFKSAVCAAHPEMKECG
jgi:hypothetical protein